LRVEALAEAASMVVVFMEAVLAEAAGAAVAGAAAAGAAVGVELAGEVAAGDGVDRPSGPWASAWVWDLRVLMQAGVRAGTTAGVRGGAATHV
jgi:hypothetical protein